MEQSRKSELLRLRAQDHEDLAVIAAILQDSLVTLADMSFDREQKRFTAVLNRFCWEELASGQAASERQGHRIHCALVFDHVVDIKCKGIDQHNRLQFLDLLTLTLDQGAVLFSFADRAVLRLDIEDLDCRLADIGHNWPTQSIPRHRS